MTSLSRVGRVATGAPLNGSKEVAGPEKLRLDKFIRAILAARADPREVVTDDHADYFGAQLQENTLVPGPGAELATTRYEAWAADRGVWLQTRDQRQLQFGALAMIGYLSSRALTTLGEQTDPVWPQILAAPAILLTLGAGLALLWSMAWRFGDERPA